MSQPRSRRLAAVAFLLLFALLLQVDRGGAQDTTPAAVADPCLAAPESWSAGAMWPGMMTPGAIWPGMMTPGAMGPGMMGDPELMTLDMLRYHVMVDTAIAQVAVARAEQPELRALAEELLRTRQAEADQLNQWRQQWYPGQPELPMGPMMGPMMGMMMGPMMGAMMQGTPWPGMPGLPDASAMLPIMGMMGMGPNGAVTALCAADQVDSVVVDALIFSAQMAQVMPQMMQQWVTQPELRQFAQDSALTRSQELERLLPLRQMPATGTETATPSSG